MKQSISHKNRGLSQSDHEDFSEQSEAFLWFRLLRQNTLIFLMIVVMGLMLLGTLGAVFAWILTLIWSLRGVDEAFEALILSVFISMANPAIFTLLPFALLLRWLVFGLAILRIGYELKKSEQVARFPGQVLFFLFIVYTALSAVLVSPLISLSLVKLAQFAIGIWIIYLGANQLAKRNWIYNIVGFGIVILLASFFVSLAGFGYERNAQGFQGITNQPQALGIIIGITVAVAIAQWVLKEGKITPIRLSLLILLLGGLFLSQARIGAVIIIASLFISLLLLLGRYSFSWNRLLTHPMTYFALALMLVYWMVNPNVGQDITRFFLKSTAIDSEENEFFYTSSQLFFSSRGALVDVSMRNFRQSPFLGIGFGIPSHIPMFDLRLAATYALPDAVRIADFVIWSDAEKGFIGTAALEETGVIGTALLSLFLLAQLIVLRKRADVVLLTLFVASLAVNIGEAVLFSFGGLGRYVIICMAIAMAAKQPTES